MLFDVITEADLSERMSQYRAIIFPNASCLSAESKALLRQFAAAGGGLIGSYESGLYDATGQRAESDDFADSFGVTYSGERLPFELDIYMQVAAAHDLPTAIPAGKRMPTMGMQVAVEPAVARAVAYVQGASEVHYGPLSDETGPPVVLTHQSAAGGRSVYFAIPIGVRYLEFGIRDFRRLIADAVAWTAQQPAPIRVRGASDTLALTAYRQDGRTLIHLVNSVRDETRLPINETIPSKAVVVEVDLEAPARQVTALGDETDISWEMVGESLRIGLAEVRYHLLLVVV